MSERDRIANKAVRDVRRSDDIAKTWWTVDGNMRHTMPVAARRAVELTARRCAEIASGFTLDGDACNVHPDIPFKAMNESAQQGAHSTAQGIAFAILAAFGLEASDER